jgi:predicted metalloenzyme YecM
MHNIFKSQIISKYFSKEKLETYFKDLKKWLKDFSLEDYVGFPDHFAIKVENEEKFNELVNEFKNFCINKIGSTPGLSIRQMHGRKIAVAILKQPIVFFDKEINCVEIMQPRPEVEGDDVVGLDHLEFISSDLENIENKLKGKDLNYYVDESNPYKEIIVSFVNSKKERVKFTNKTLAEIVPKQIEDEPERVEIILN